MQTLIPRKLDLKSSLGSLCGASLLIASTLFSLTSSAQTPAQNWGPSKPFAMPTWLKGSIGIKISAFSEERDNQYNYSTFLKLNSFYSYGSKDRVMVTETGTEDGVPYNNYGYVNQPGIAGFSIVKQIGAPGKRTIGNLEVGYYGIFQTIRYVHILNGVQGNNYQYRSLGLKMDERVSQLGIAYNQDVLILKPESRFNVFVTGGFRANIGLSSRVNVTGYEENSVTDMDYNQISMTKNTIEEHGRGSTQSMLGAQIGLGAQFKLSNLISLRTAVQTNTMRFYKDKTAVRYNTNRTSYDLSILFNLHQ